jgi:hypothetical protein
MHLDSAKLVALTAMVVAPLLLVGCGGGGGGGNGAEGGGSRSAAQQDLCDSLKSLNNSLTELDSLQPQTASTADIDAAAAKVRAAGKKAATSADAVSSTEVNSVTIAASRLVTAVRQVPAGTSVKQELQMVQPALEGTRKQFQAVYNGLSCGSAG